MIIKKLKSFEKDYKNLNKKHYNFSEFLKVLNIIFNNQILPNKYKNHFLKGEYKGCQECHIENNILLIYRIEDNDIILIRLGTHDDLF